MKIDAISVTSTDLHKTVAFYTALGFSFPEYTPDEDHLEAVPEPGAVRLMIDSATLIESIIGKKPTPANHSSFALLCESPEEVNMIAQNIKDAGFTVSKEPWDAFWGQRYAIVTDPDGYSIDLFARL